MKKKNNKKTMLYHIEEFDTDTLYSMFCDYSKSKGLKKHVKNKVLYGIEMLLYFIAYQQIAKYDKDKGLGTAEINYYIANKVIGTIFEDVKNFLVDSNIINVVGGYIPGKKSYSYIINPKYTIKEWYINYSYPNIFMDKLNKAISNYEKKNNKLPKQEKEFIKTYQNNLNKIKLTNKKGLLDYINNFDYSYQQDVKQRGKIKHKKGEINNNKKLFYDYSYNVFDSIEHPIYKIDDYGRIHHFITNSPKAFRKYLNLLFECDVHNCQPLLIVPLLYEFYNVPREVQTIIAKDYIDWLMDVREWDIYIRKEYKEDVFTYHYEIIPPCNNHNNSYLHSIKNKIDSLPIDFIEYLHLTMSGKLWDMLAKLFNVSRNEVKTLMFAELFYSNTSKITSWQKYGKMFQERFPNVTNAILHIRNSNPKSWLPKEMQRRESEIMRNVLSSLFKNGFNVVSIHDAIVFMDTDNNIEKGKYGEDYDETIAYLEDLIKFEMECAYYEAGLGVCIGCSFIPEA